MQEEITDYRESHTKEGTGKVYDDSFHQYSSRREMWKWEQKVLDLIFKDLQPNSSILDFACGTGRILQFLNDKSTDVTGVDISDSMLEISRSRDLSNVTLVKADLTRNNPFSGKRKFDVITSFRFFLNAQHSLRKEVLKELNLVLEDDGIFIFNNHGNSSSPSMIFKKIILGLKNIFRSPEKKYKNVHYLSHSTMKSILKEYNFKIIKTYHRGTWPFPNEKTSIDVSKFNKIEDWFSKQAIFMKSSVNVIYVCKKQ